MSCGRTVDIHPGPKLICILLEYQLSFEQHYVHTYVHMYYSTHLNCISLHIPIIGAPSCPTVTTVRSDDFTNATVSWQQPSNTPVTSTTVIYCPTSSPNCGNSMNCNSPCTISGLDPCMDYSFTVILNNNCGNATGCIENSKNVTSQGQVFIWCAYIQCFSSILHNYKY